MASLDETLKIRDYKNLYIKNTVALNKSELVKADYKYFNKEKVLHFVVSVKINGKKHRRQLPPFGAVGKNVSTVIQEADVSAKLLIAELKQGKSLVKELKIFTQLWKEYSELKVATKKVKESYKRNNDYLYNKHLKDTIGHLKTPQITSEQIQGVINKMLKDGYAPATTDQLRKVFGIVFKDAIERGEIEKSPMDKVEIPEYDNERDFTLSEKKSKQLYDALMNYYSPKYRGIFMFLLEGRRKDEVLSLTWDRVDLTEKKYWFESTQNKSKKKRTFVLPEHIIEVLESLPDTRTGYVFKNPRGTRANGGLPGGKIGDFRKRWKTILKNLDINEDVHIHDLRHWIGNTAVNSGATFEEISYVLGQSSATIAKRYSKIRENTANSTVRNVHEILSGNVKTK